jgi:hypothetical protein
MNREQYLKAKTSHLEFLYAEIEHNVVTLGKLIILRFSAEEIEDEPMYININNKIINVKADIAELKKNVKVLEKEINS